ncbi:PREDICTED: seizure 6-like protein 2 isoform X1 [Branchiostoma belcheri]|uniref:Seizure 6-like protein 2 isoform X1 n=1 Tax=Branchiostoma belcheri TaxID=7741 RepID=A0A6P4Z9R3_BRABE|nr:PREDICTED: seizure 6-like protein 2 isoform X1 [Branchiostoma belcheri]
MWRVRLVLAATLVALFGAARGQCGGTLSEETGELISPGFPTGYPSNSECTWIIRGDVEDTILIFFDSFNVEADDSCRYDYLRFTIDGQTGDRLCGAGFSEFENITVTGEILVFFKSDGTVNMPGFRLIYRIVSPTTTTTPAPTTTTITTAQRAESGQPAQPGDCSDPGTPPDGSRELSSLAPGSTATFTCNDGFVLVGAATLTCLDTGQWDASRPTCSASGSGQPPGSGHCSNPGLPTNGLSVLSDVQFRQGDSIQFYCDDGYELTGSSELLCDGSGSWSAQLPVCVPDGTLTAGTPTWAIACIAVGAVVGLGIIAAILYMLIKTPPKAVRGGTGQVIPL